MSQKPTYEELERAEVGRKHVEEALRESELRYRTIFEQNLNPIAIIDAKGRYLDANPAFLKFVARTKESLLQMSVFDFSSLGKRISQEIVHRPVWREGGTLETEYFIDDKIKILELTITPITYKGISAILGVGKDITEHKRAEEELHQSEKRFRGLADSLPQIVFETDEKGLITFANRNAFDYFSYTKSEFGKKLNAFQMVSPEDRDRAVENFQKVLNGEILGGIEYTALRKDGSTFPVEIHSTVFSRANKPIGLRGIIIDLSKRKQAEEVLRKERDKAQTYLDIASVIIVVINADQSVAVINKKGCETLGYEESEIIGKKWIEKFIPKRDREKTRTTFFELIAGNIELVEYFENYVLTKDNKEKLIAWHNSILRDDGGQIIATLSSGEDITERKQVEEALRESEERHRSTMEAMKDAAYICSSELRIEYMNPTMIDRVGRDAPGELCYKVIYDEDEKCPWCVFDQVRQGKQATHEKKDPKTGHYYSINCSSVVRSDAPTSQLCIIRDITEIKMMEKERLATETKLQQALKMESIGILAGGIAHDFNNILSSIIGYTELSLDAVEKGSRLEDHLQEVFTAGLRAGDLVKQILTFARQTGEELKPVQVDNIAKEALKLLRSSLPTTIEIEQDIESTSLIMADSTQVHQILMNLCTNAGQAMEEEGGVLRVGLTDVRLDADFTKTYADLKPGDYLKLSISDTGFGIPSEVKKSIFDPYFTTKASGEGTGMGLATTHGIVKQYGGEIMVESKVNKGSTFTVYLPITKKRTEAESYKAEALPVGTEQILFVDDELPIANMGGQILEKLGYQVTVRTSSVEALALFRFKSNDFDLVITDMTMPNMTGDRLAVELMKIRPDIPVILCTGYSKKMSAETVLEMGIKALAYKPIVAADLAKTVRTVLDDKQGKKIKQILLIDDEPQLRKLFIQKLVGRGYAIIEASDGNDGIKRYRENKPDLVITDLVMPEKEGIEMITELKKDDPNLKFIAISGGGRNDPGTYLQIAKNLGAARTFSKPIDWPKLIETVKELLN